MRPCCSTPDPGATAVRRSRRSAGRASARSGRRRRRCSAAARRTATGSSRCMRKNGSKICRIGWPKPSAVSCMRAVCHGIAAVPRRRRGAGARGRAGARAAKASAKLAATPEQEDHRTVARAVDADRRPAASRSPATVLPRPAADELARDRIDQLDELRPATGPSATQPSASQTMPTRSQGPASLRLAQASPRAAGRGR